MPRRQPTPPERSPEERARAAAERAARRGETAPPPETFIARNAQPPEPEPEPNEDPFRVERARPEPEPAPAAEEGSWFEEESEREVMPEDPFPQETQEFHPEWIEEDEAVEWEVPEPVAQVPAARPGGDGRLQRPVAPRRSGRGLPPRGPRSPLIAQRSNGRRPAGSPRGRSGRRILAVLALAFIGGALWLINATFQPFHDDPTGAVAMTIPQGADAGQIGELLKDAA